MFVHIVLRLDLQGADSFLYTPEVYAQRRSNLWATHLSMFRVLRKAVLLIVCRAQLHNNTL